MEASADWDAETTEDWRIKCTLAKQWVQTAGAGPNPREFALVAKAAAQWAFMAAQQRL